MSRAATPCFLIAAMTRRMAAEFLLSAALALASFELTPREKLMRFGFALIVALALTVIVLFVELEPQAVVRPSTSSATSARARVECFIGPPRRAVDEILTRRAASTQVRRSRYCLLYTSPSPRD